MNLPTVVRITECISGKAIFFGGLLLILRFFEIAEDNNDKDNK